MSSGKPFSAATGVSSKAAMTSARGVSVAPPTNPTVAVGISYAQQYAAQQKALAKNAAVNPATSYREQVSKVYALGTPTEERQRPIQAGKTGGPTKTVPVYTTQPGGAAGGRDPVMYDQEEEYSYATPPPGAAPASGEGGGAGPQDYYLPGEQEQYQSASSVSNMTAMTASQAAKAVAIVPAVVPKPNIIARFFQWLAGLFGPKTTPAPAAIAGENGEHQSEAAKVVRRARNGDQVAMALIAGVFEQAKLNNPKAVESLRQILRYINANPVEASMAGECECQDEDVAAARFAMNPLSNASIGGVLATFGYEEQQAFEYAFDNAPRIRAIHSNDQELELAAKMGKAIGLAYRIQQVSQPDSSISEYNRVAGWELGE